MFPSSSIQANYLPVWKRIPSVTCSSCHRGGSRSAYPPSPQPLFTSRRGLDDFPRGLGGTKGRNRWPSFYLSSLNFHCFPKVSSCYFSTASARRRLETTHSSKPCPSQRRTTLPAASSSWSLQPHLPNPTQATAVRKPLIRY